MSEEVFVVSSSEMKSRRGQNVGGLLVFSDHSVGREKSQQPKLS